MKHKLAYAVVIALMMLAACDEWRPHEHPKLCSDGAAHQWSEWSDIWATPGPNGHILQIRHCNKCKVKETGYHK